MVSFTAVCGAGWTHFAYPDWTTVHSTSMPFIPLWLQLHYTAETIVTGPACPFQSVLANILSEVVLLSNCSADSSNHNSNYHVMWTHICTRVMFHHYAYHFFYSKEKKNTLREFVVDWKGKVQKKEKLVNPWVFIP